MIIPVRIPSRGPKDLIGLYQWSKRSVRVQPTGENGMLGFHRGVKKIR